MNKIDNWHSQSKALFHNCKYNVFIMLNIVSCAKNRRLVLNGSEAKRLSLIYLKICFSDLPHLCLSNSGWCNNARLLCFATRCVHLQKTTLPPLSDSPQFAAVNLRDCNNRCHGVLPRG